MSKIKKLFNCGIAVMEMIYQLNLKKHNTYYENNVTNNKKKNDHEEAK